VSKKRELTDEQKMLMFKFLMSLNVVRNGKIYVGTVSHKEKMRRRAKGKVAKATRKGNR